jgi:hypothetical protein
MPAVALAAGTLVLSPAVPAHAAESPSSRNGKATAVVLRTGLDVSLIGRSVDVPLNVSLNDVHAPADADATALTAKLDAVDHGRPFSVLRADIATARATADGHRAEGYVSLVDARVNLPGLPSLGLIRAAAVTSRATCEAGRKPTARSSVLGRVAVLGKSVTVGAGGPTRVRVPGIGEVRLDLSKRGTTSRTAAATALVLTVKVDPLDLNVARVTGQVTLAAASCETPREAPRHAPKETPRQAPQQTQAADSTSSVTAGAGAGTATETGTETTPPTGTKAKAQNVATTDATEQKLADTGGSPATQYLAAGSAALLAVGSVVAYAARRRKPATADVKDAEEQD